MADSLQKSEQPRVSIPAAATWGGFFASSPLWLAWYITHLPWTGLSEAQALPIVLITWFAALVAAARQLPGVPLPATAGAGLVSAAAGLLVLGSRLVTPAASGGPGAGDAVPQAPLIVAGFLTCGALLGLAAGVFGRALKPSPTAIAGTPAGMAIASIMLAAPLLFAGGLVTSADAGMAVPDWPNTFGTNMFLYPLGPRVQPVVGHDYASIYLEHAHRLFGALVGLSTLVLTIWVLRAEKRRWVKVITCSLFAFVVLQGLLGGQRVVLNTRLLAMFHGVSAQLILAVLVLIAASLSPSFRSATAPRVANHRRIRALTGAAVHASILQLILGATYRHFRDGPGGGHALWTHVGFSLVVLTVGVLGASLAAGADAPEAPAHPLVRSLRRSGALAITLVGIQFGLGWLTLFLGGREVAAPSVGQALLRTAHQANGALMLAAFTFAAVYARRLSWLNTRSVPG
ncbi:MAG: COX15/CtaA family protein [Phycisphaerales bacterium]